MIADRSSIPLVTLVAIGVTLAIASRSRGADAPRVAHDEAAELSARAQRAWADVDAGFARLDAGLAAIDAKLVAALDAPRGCPSPRDLRAARAKLAELKRQRAEILRRLAKARSEAGAICRLPPRKGRRVIIDTACIDNPLARGCM